MGTKEAPPFSMKNKGGKWEGISVELWRQIAAEMNLAFEFRELTLKQLLQGVADGSLDAAVAAITVTPEREKLFDFTHPFYTTGLGIAVTSKKGRPWVAVVKRILSPAFLKVAIALALLLFSVGLLAWWFERRKNPQQFGGGVARGIGSGFWWSAVTMTTVGYGDKAPLTLGGRIVAIIWMFAAVIIISSFTAAITSSLTVSQLESLVKGPEDLTKVRNGSIPDTTSAAYLKENYISFLSYNTPLDGLKAISEGNIDALVYDAPVLQYLVNKEFKGILEVLPKVFVPQDYGIALKPGSPLREPVNRILLQKIREPEWQDIVSRYLGQ
ncbi:transporter substrate-binding domain-containing protein [bacterium]|nr:transporter substrate-binding domain-containing protein [bacterium]